MTIDCGPNRNTEPRTTEPSARAYRLAACLAFLSSAALADQQPPPPSPPPGWHGNLGAGLAITNGNSDTQSYNLAGLVTYDPHRKDVLKLDGLYLKSTANGVSTMAKSASGVRGERRFSKRAFAFGEVRHQRDRFKALRSLISPVAGAGVRVVATSGVVFDVFSGIGLAFERLEDRDGTTSGALRSGHGLAWKISPSAAFTHNASALWKMNDFGDAFYHVDFGLAASISKKWELKLAALTDFKSRPARPGLKKRDDALVAALGFKF